MNTEFTVPAVIMKKAIIILMLLVTGCRGATTLNAPTEMPRFPWPPPEPSAFMKIPDHILFQPDNGRPCLGDICNELTRKLDASGYIEKTYFAISENNELNGFAIATRMEQINSDGTSKLEDRWNPKLATFDSLSPLEWLKSYIFGHPGFFRIIVFAVTPQSSTSVKGKKIDRAAAERLYAEGAIDLPGSIRQLKYSGEYVTIALIYEFKKNESSDPVQTLPSSIDGSRHMENAGLIPVSRERVL